MIDSAQLLADLKGQLKLLEADLTARADDVTNGWGAALRTEHANATARERTGLPWIDWRNGQVAQAAVAWILATVFIRFAEDNDLLEGVTIDGARAALPWFAGPGERLERAVEHQSAFFTANPTAAGPDWLKQSFSALASLPAGRALVDPAHSPVWRAPISGEAADRLLDFWRVTDSSGALVRDFTDSALDTRFLGDLYQDLSEFAKKQYALLQTPVFVEEFILDQTLTPAIAEFGLESLKLIDPTCGSGHFLLGAFGRLVDAWTVEAPALDARERVAKALASVHGVDLNPFAVAIARFRLTVAALQAAGDRTLVAAPDYHLKLAIGDSLLGSQASSVRLFDGENADAFEYSVEDLAGYHGILQQNQYHVVVGNPPYIAVSDRAQKKTYGQLYSACSGHWVLSVPFMQLFFELAVRSESTAGSGYVGQITSDSFSKREFGETLVRDFLSGNDLASPVDLTLVVDSAGAWIPGHNFEGTPTVMLFGRRRRPISTTVRVVESIRSEAGRPEVPSRSATWQEIVAAANGELLSGEFVAAEESPRSLIAEHPWVLRHGAKPLLDQMMASSGRRVRGMVARAGFFGVVGVDDAFVVPQGFASRVHLESSFRRLAIGDGVRDYAVDANEEVYFPYSSTHVLDGEPARFLWPLRSSLGGRASYSGLSYAAEGRPWHGWHQLPLDSGASAVSIVWAEVATHNHFSLDSGSYAFKQTAPILKFAGSVSGEDIEGLLGVLNSSVGCFYLRQVCYPKDRSPEEWRSRFAFNATNVTRMPLPDQLPNVRGKELALLSRHVSSADASAMLNGTGTRRDFSERAAKMGASWNLFRGRMIFEQEELDWDVYRLYGLIDDDLTYSGDFDGLDLGQRAFEIALARRVAAGDEQTMWFARHGSTPITELPVEWPTDYRAVVERRLEALAANPGVRLLERPEFKRRWATRSWDDQLADALRDAMLNHLESAAHWTDMNGRPVTRSVNELADLLKSDAWFVELASLAYGADADLRTVIGKLLDDESVPYLAALRYKPSGFEKFRAWEHTWELQRAEDRGERVEVPVPSKYGQGDFRKSTYWKARGKLDVPKERFISYPGTNRANDPSPVYGWAGWNHADRAQALARLPMELLAAGATSDDLAPLIGGLIELQPWLDQWHAELDPNLGVSPALAISGLTDQLLTQLQLARDSVTGWQPPVATRGRAASKGTK
ncbi:hypothetical protein J2X63_002099 [Agromyces sp. 3263]|uniref:BREX-2 system adenine-specific DNA-methyltransferase PglX n=1 Tax=Agromyces sp. 3263 TaxID=2817750 RepID=UPI00285696A4|nr:BREX-2 system adenine-specific DNA-methyltransferase PglX [Agromyces sp. 3263]MDR6906413.1 hypothetical protein [Agromyces sp. 3263]